MREIVDILKTNTNSINIRNDYTNLEKINLYYPSYKTLKLLEKFLKIISSNKRGSFILEGAYGTGKSFFTAILLNILSGNYSKKNYENFLLKANKIYNLENQLENYNSKKYFIVFINDLIGEFSKDLSLALYQSAKNNNIVLNLSSDFEVIEDRIKSWKSNYNITYKSFISAIEKEIGIKKFYELLEEKDLKAVEIFKNTYPKIFAGEKYISLEKIRNIEELLREVEKQVISYGYDGIIYTFDEFGRYLESNIKNIDVKEVQDMAEYCNEENKSNFLVITHKDIYHYRKKSKLRENIDEWNKVSGRFLKEVFIYEKFNTLEILENILKKNDYDKYRELYLKEFKQKEKLLESLKIDDSYEKVKKYYPLDYFTAMILPNFSQKFAQNERTLFSFISGQETYGLKNLLIEGKDRFIGIDSLYDYFEKCFKDLNYDDINYKLYIQSKSIINLLKNEDEIFIKFIKTLTIVYVNNNFTEIKPNYETLKYLMNIEDLDSIINKLKEKNYIQYHRYNECFKLTEDFDINIEKEIEKYINNKLSNFNFMETLNKVLKKEYYYPLKYNDEYKINRYLGKYYLDVSYIKDIEKINKEKYEDGKIIYLTNIKNNENYNIILKQIEKLSDYIIIYNKDGEILNIEGYLEILEAIRRIKILDVRYLNNRTFILEINAYENEVMEKLFEELEKYFSKNNSGILIKGNQVDSLINGTFEYLKDKYNKYFKINYELINKHNLTPQIKKSRLEVLRKLIEEEPLEDEYFNGTTAESSLARILLRKTNSYEEYKFNIEKSIYREIYLEILDIIKKEKISLSKLYLKFCSNESSYGIKKGIFSFILGLVLINNIEEISISLKETNTEVINELGLIDKIEKNPEKYEIFYFPITDEQIKYLASLENLFTLYIKNKEEKIYNKVLGGMKTYLLNSPRYMIGIYLSEFKKLNKIFKGILGINNGREFILKDIPKIYKENYEDTFKLFKNDIAEFENKKNIFIKELKKDIIESLGYSCLDFKDLIEELNKKTDLNEIEKEILKLKSYNENEILEKLTEKIKGFSFENWRSLEEKEEFFKILKEKSEFKPKSTQEENDIKIIMNGEVKEISLLEESPIGKIMKSKLKSVIKNMGTSVTEEEKKNILLKILLEL